MNKIGYKRESQPQTKRYCQYLELNPETLEEYKKWHSPGVAWPEISQGMKEVGLLDMEIYLIENKAFMIIETPINFDFKEAFDRLATLDRQEEWEAFMAKYQLGADGKRSDEKWQLMERIFSMVECLK